MERLRKVDPVAVPVDAPARLPENCLVRLMDLEPGVSGLISVDETGFVNIYINARLSYEERLRALRHELRHYYREDLYSDVDIREVERLAEGPVVRTVDGTPVEAMPPGFDPAGLRDEGGGRYRLTGGNLSRAAADLRRVRALLLDACRIVDVAQPSPFISIRSLSTLAEALSLDDLSAIAFQPEGAPLSAALPFRREDTGQIYGTMFYDRRGQLDNALVVFVLEARCVTVDLRRRQGRLDVSAIAVEAGGRTVKVY